MTAQNTDLVRMLTPKFATALDASIEASDTTIPLESVEGLSLTTAVTINIDETDNNGNPSPEFREEVTGVVNPEANTLVNCIRGLGGTTAQPHNSGASAVQWWDAIMINDFMTAYLEQHTQQGAHTQIVTDTLDVTESVSPNVFIDLVYPIGSIYTELTGVNPGTTFGRGTWVQYAEGQVLVGQLGGDPNFGTVGQTGGSVNHWHWQTVGADANRIFAENGGSGSGQSRVLSVPSSVNAVDNVQGTSNMRADGTYTASSLQPYITVYFWHRTA